MINDLISRAAAVRALASSNGDYLDALERLEKIPAVDAIPVEWLENKRENLILAAMVHSTVYGDNSIELCRAVNVVLTMWEKEQEAR